ncbi:murein hydrolase activator EnvC family protein [Ruania zhangjianzhongii]|uniref:murein hydrolase activator EnvC family protein n=1 Tax=Ruania zhangjianzhongii TaxID=2603206 RepID=UPI001F1CBF95|nr:M23 family metallopeptidase [Ruania zhangjianzhongii]
MLSALLLALAVLAGIAPARAAPANTPTPGPLLLAPAGARGTGSLDTGPLLTGPLGTRPLSTGPPATRPLSTEPLPTDISTSQSGYDWPVAGDGGAPAVLRRFDPPPLPWLSGHRGVDLAAEAGATVRAAGPGTVAFAGMVAGRPVVSIQHTDGLRTTYEPVTPTVQAGDAVDRGSMIGQLSDAGSHCESTCLHWGVRTGRDDYLDPLLLLGAEVVIRLYPPTQG